MKTCLAFSIAVVVGVSSAVAHAEDQCVAVHKQAQIDRKANQFKKARTELLLCKKAECPEMIASDCTQWLVELDRVTPSIVIVATDKTGHDAREVRVSVDGEPLLEHLDGSAIPVDPGEHRFRFEMGGAPAVEKQLLIHEAEQARRVEVVFETTKGPKPPPAHTAQRTPRLEPGPEQHASGGPGAFPYALGAVGVVALGASGYFYYRGFSKKSELDDSGCKPNCPASEVDSGKRSILIADITAGIGVAALGTAVFLLLTAPSEKSAVVSPMLAPGAGGVSPRGRF